MGQFDGRGDGEGDVAVLVAAFQGGIDEDFCTLDWDWNRNWDLDRIGIDWTCVHWGHVRGGVDAPDLQFRGDFADGLVGFRMLGEGDQGAAGTEDAGFFAGDEADGRAEPLLVIERDVGDDGEDGGDDVGGVETASHAYFEDGEIDAGFREVNEGEGGEEFEVAGEGGEGGVEDELPGGRVDAEIEAGEVFVGDVAAVELDALVDAVEVRRGVEANAQA